MRPAGADDTQTRSFPANGFVICAPIVSHYKVRIEQLGKLDSAPAVLRRLADACAELDLPLPAALIGEWFGSSAVIAPSVAIEAVAPVDAFDVPTGSGDAVGGGWFGYLSYPDDGADGHPPRVPEAAGGWSDCVLRQDRDENWWYESLSGNPMPAWVAAALQRPVRHRDWHIDWRPADRETHQRGVRECLEAIAAGEIYQACVCTQYHGLLTGDPIDFFVTAAARTVPAKAAFLTGSWGAVASLSPELFLRRDNRTLTSSPIKGTLPLDLPPSALTSSVKDVAENIMIVDLVRNDLSRVARTGSVTVPELLAVRPAPGVWHLVSTVQSDIDPAVPMRTVLEATFPPASVTGTPKTRARQLLTEWEPERRGIYCGAIGLASPAAGAELNVAIRTVEFTAEGVAVFGVGGGITADSDPDAEWQECLHKAAPTIGLRG